MSEAAAINAGAEPWRLFFLAERSEFDRHVELAAAAIADRFTFKAHVNIAARHSAYRAWLGRVRRIGKGPPDYRAFVAVCAALIAALAAHKAVGFSAMVREPDDRMASTVLKYGNEVAALAAGAALYAIVVEDLTGMSPAEPLPAALVENAAASLRKNSEAALRFRELLRLSTPWV